MGRTFIPFRNLGCSNLINECITLIFNGILCVIGTETGFAIGSASVHDLGQTRQEPPVLVFNPPDPLMLDLQLLRLELNLELIRPH